MGAEIPEQGHQQPDYLGDHDRKDPLVSPMFADLKGFPAHPLHDRHARRGAGEHLELQPRAAARRRAHRTRGVRSSMPHAFWYTTGVPESTEALQIQANFFDQHLGK